MGQVVPFKRKSAILSKEAVSNVSLRSIAAFYADRDGQFDFVNSDWCRLANCSQEEAFGEGWLNSIYPSDRLQTAQHWRDAVKNEKFVSLQFRLARATALQVVFQALPQYDSDGHFTGYSGSLIALEPFNYHAETALLASSGSPGADGIDKASARERRLRDAMDLAGLFYFEHDLITGTTHRSKRLKELFGGNRNIAELTAALHPEDAPRFWDHHHRCVAAKVPCLNEYRVTFPGRETMQVKSQGLFSYDRAGNAVSIFGFTLLASDWSKKWDSSAIELLHKITTLSI